MFAKHDENLLRLQMENERLRRAVEELSLLNEIAVAINSTLSLDRILDLMLRKCLKAMGLEQGAVMLLDKKDQGNPFRTKVRRGDTGAEILPFRLDTQLTGWMLKNNRPLIVNNLSNDPRFRSVAEAELPIRSLLSVPLTAKGKMIGLLSVFNKKEDSGFTDEDQRLLAIIAAQSAQVIENSRLLEEEKALFRMQQELRLAYEIQTNLLPVAAPLIPGYEIAGRSIPAKEVGGDYYDFMMLSDSRMAFCLGDITGKGMPAALLMSNLQATVRGQAALAGSAQECVQRANVLLFHSTAPGKYATFFYGILDMDNHAVNYCNAGHNYPLLFRGDKEIVRLTTGGMVLGCLEEFPYEDECVLLDPGDMLVVFSDGITESTNHCDIEFEEAMLIEVIRRYRGEDVEVLVDHIWRAVEEHAAGCTQYDDMTLVVIRRKGK